MKIVVRTPNWIGDVLMSFPAIESLARGLPEAEIWIAAHPWVKDLFVGTDYADRILPIRPPKNLRDLGRTAAILRSGRFDAGLLLTNSFASALLFRRANIPERWGYRRDGRGPLLTKGVIPKDGGRSVHMVRTYLELIQGLGLPLRPAEIRLAAAPDEKERSRIILEQAGADLSRPLVFLHAGASFGPAKRWPAERFAALGRILMERKKAGLVLTGSAEDAPVAEAIASRLPRPPANLVGRTTLRELVGAVSQAALFVTNDTGPMHLANALRVPVMAVFGPTDPAVTAPFHPPAVVLKKDAVCWPCLYRECPYDHRCMTGVGAEEAAAAAAEYLP